MGAPLGVSQRQVSGWGGASPSRAGGGTWRRGRVWRVWRNRGWGAAAGRPGSWRRAGLRARGGGDCGGAAGAGRAASPEAEEAEPRSQLRPGRRAPQTTPARSRARTARAHSPNNAPRRPAGQLAARRQTARPGERGPEVSPRRLLQIRPLFVWQTWPQRGALEERRDCPAGDPLSASPGVTGDPLGRVEGRDRVRPGLCRRGRRRA